MVPHSNGVFSSLLCRPTCPSCRNRVGGLEYENLEEVLEDLRGLGWSEGTLGSLERQASSYMALYSKYKWNEGQLLLLLRLRWE